MIALQLIMVMERRHFKDPPPDTELSPCVFEPTDLHHHRKIFSQKDTTEYRYQDLLPDHDGKNRDNAPQGETPGVAHENLRRVRVVP